MNPGDYLRARGKNKLYRFLLDDGQIRGAIYDGAHMIREMRANHELGILETYILGQAFLGASLLTIILKDKEHINLKIDCDGPISGISVDANSFGEVRGYIKNPHIELSEPLESFDLAPFFGQGQLSVTRFPEFAKTPFTGQVELKYGSPAKDLAYYFTTSEQTPSSFNLGINFDREGEVSGAGGLFLQVMPGGDDKRLLELEHTLHNLPSMGKAFTGDITPEAFLNTHLSKFKPQVLGNKRMEFYCRCKKETIAQFLEKLPVETLQEMTEGPFPLKTNCRNCNTDYQFSEEEIRGYYEKKLN